MIPVANLAVALRDARSRIAAGASVFVALQRSIPPDDFQAAVDLLHGLFLPTAAAYERAVLRYHQTRNDADAIAALQLAGLPGAQLQFWTWLESEGRQPWTILEGFDRAILRAARS